MADGRMSGFTIPPDDRVQRAVTDPHRLALLNAAAILDSPPDESFDRLTRLASELLDAPVSLVSLVAEDRQFFKSSVGLPEPLADQRETSLSQSICQYVVANREPLVIHDARLDHRLQENSAVRDLGVVAYLGVPIKVSQGQVLGSFCAIDGVPRKWTAKQVSIMQDLAASMRQEIEMRLLVRQLQENHLTLRQEKVEAEEMAQMLAHDLRTPLSGILGNLELAELRLKQGRSLTTELANAKVSADFLMQLVNSLMDLNKAEAGGLTLKIEPVSPFKLVEDAVGHVEPLARVSNVDLVTRANPETLDLLGDSLQLRRLLINLIANAIQNTPRQGRVEVRIFSPDAETCVFEVEDSGRGIPKDAFDLIFEKFGQVEARRFNASGTGLGLPLCKWVVNAHGGAISVQSELGQGTVFRVELPAQAPG